jgi:MFS family permease
MEMASSGRSLRPWWAVAAAAIALVMGNGPVMQFTFGMFIAPLAAEFRAGRDQISLALAIGLCLTGLCMPVAGKLVDRYGARRVTLPAIVLLGALLMTAALAESLLQLIAIFAVMGIIASGQTPLPYSRVIATRFDVHRGLALGMAMAGVGIGTALLPKLAGMAVAELGWRTAYFGLGLSVIVIALPAAYFALDEQNIDSKDTAKDDLSGPTALQALKTREIWLLAVAFFLSTLCASGLLAHVVSLLADSGVPAGKGVTAISVAGISLVAGRVLSGYLVDRLPPAWVAAAFFVGQAFGIAILLIGPTGLPVAIAACILVGLGLGAEVDLLGFMLSRLFGLRAFGTLYGILFGVFMLANGLGPLIMGRAYAAFGSYHVALLIFEAGLAGAVASILAIGPALKGNDPVARRIRAAAT